MLMDAETEWPFFGLDRNFCWNHLRNCAITSIAHLQVHGQRSCPITWMISLYPHKHFFFARPFSPASGRTNLFQPTAASVILIDCYSLIVAQHSSWPCCRIDYATQFFIAISNPHCI